jgi:hypothetical protein
MASTILNFQQIDQIRTEESMHIAILPNRTAIVSESILFIKEETGVTRDGHAVGWARIQIRNMGTMLGQHCVLDDRGNGERHVMQEWIEANQTKSE